MEGAPQQTGMAMNVLAVLALLALPAARGADFSARVAGLLVAQPEACLANEPHPLVDAVACTDALLLEAGVMKSETVRSMLSGICATYSAGGAAFCACRCKSHVCRSKKRKKERKFKRKKKKERKGKIMEN